MGMALLFPEPEYFVPALRAPVPPAAVLQKGPLFAAPVQRYASRLDVAVVTHLVPQLLAPLRRFSKWMCLVILHQCVLVPSFRRTPRRPWILFQTICLRNEIVENNHSFFYLMATEAIDTSFRAVIEQLQPKQGAINLRPPKHPDLAVPNRGKRNRRFQTILRNAREFDVGSRDSQFGKRRLRHAVHGKP